MMENATRRYNCSIAACGSAKPALPTITSTISRYPLPESASAPSCSPVQIKSCVFCPDFFCGRNLHDAILYFEEDKIVSKAIYEKKGRSLLTLYVSFQPISMVEYKQYEAMIRKARKNNEVNSDTEWDLFEKAFLGNRIITKISVPDVVR